MIHSAATLVGLSCWRPPERFDQRAHARRGVGAAGATTRPLGGSSSSLHSLTLIAARRRDPAGESTPRLRTPVLELFTPPATRRFVGRMLGSNKGSGSSSLVGRLAGVCGSRAIRGMPGGLAALQIMIFLARATGGAARSGHVVKILGKLAAPNPSAMHRAGAVGCTRAERADERLGRRRSG